MHSTEIAAVFLVAIGVIAGRFMLGVVAFIRGGNFPASLREKQPAKPAVTAFVRLVKDGVDYWQGLAVRDATEILVVAGDSWGNPNPTLLERLPGILAELDALELLSRGTVGALTDMHILHEITDDKSAAFVLGFAFDDEESGWGESVYVYFKDGEVVHWDSVG